MVAVCDALAAAYRDCLMKGIIEANTAERLPMFLDFYFNFLAGKGLRKPEDDQIYDAMFALAARSPAVRDSLREQCHPLNRVTRQAMDRIIRSYLEYYEDPNEHVSDLSGM